MPEKSLRFVDNKFAHDNEITSFSDGYPTLIIGESALNKLNELLCYIDDQKRTFQININKFFENIIRFKNNNTKEMSDTVILKL